MPRVLDRSLCEALEARWRDQGVEIVNLLRPGLSDEEMDRITAELEITLPDEARVWWGWHNGAGDTDGAWRKETTLGPGIAFDPLEVAVISCQTWREVHAEIDPSNWPSTWLPMSSLDDTAIIIDCASAHEPVTVQWYIAEGGTDGGPDLLSMGDLVETWIGAIDCGGWWYDRGSKRWESDWERLPPSLQLPGITG